jgi:hypothetical protein
MTGFRACTSHEDSMIGQRGSTVHAVITASRAARSVGESVGHKLTTQTESHDVSKTGSTQDQQDRWVGQCIPPVHTGIATHVRCARSHLARLWSNETHISPPSTHGVSFLCVSHAHHLSSACPPHSALTTHLFALAPCPGALHRRLQRDQLWSVRVCSHRQESRAAQDCVHPELILTPGEYGSHMCGYSMKRDLGHVRAHIPCW